MNYSFNAEKVHDELIQWTKDWFNKNGKDSIAVIGISGGKDSTVCAAILAEALGKDRVLGVMMPNGIQSDIVDAEKVCNILGIKKTVVNIGQTYSDLCDAINVGKSLNDPAFTTNTPARLRMTTLYGIAAVLNGRVCSTCNFSEDYCGFSTKMGDAAGDFSLLCNLTVTEVRALGDYMNLPKELVHKIPNDGMCGMSDEEKLGFTYEDLDKYIRNTEAIEINIQNKIKAIHDNPNVAKKLIIKADDCFAPSFLRYLLLEAI